VEDFWIVGPEGDFALAEAKGIGSHVRRQDVSQVEMHRAELHADEDAPPPPGLLIINVHRGSDDLGKRRMPVHPNVASHAARHDVLILRGVDLYALLGRTLAGESVGAELVEMLNSGGGWLEVSDSGLMLHAGDESAT
jgi:hypothetical protein